MAYEGGNYSIQSISQIHFECEEEEEEEDGARKHFHQQSHTHPPQRSYDLE
jgi:hypothetical protein